MQNNQTISDSDFGPRGELRVGLVPPPQIGAVNTVNHAPLHKKSRVDHMSDFGKMPWPF